AAAGGIHFLQVQCRCAGVGNLEVVDGGLVVRDFPKIERWPIDRDDGCLRRSRDGRLRRRRRGRLCCRRKSEKREGRDSQRGHKALTKESDEKWEGASPHLRCSEACHESNFDTGGFGV